MRLEMAKAAASYLHPRLQAIEPPGKDQETAPPSFRVIFVLPLEDSAPRQMPHQAETEHRKSPWPRG